MVDHDALARAHMIQQVREAGVIQVALARYWDEIVDPSDFAASFARFREVAIPLLLAGRAKSESTADAYYRALLALDGFPEGPAVARIPLAADAMRSSLGAAGQSVYTDYKLRQDGADVGAIMATAKAGVLRSAKRQVLNASRDRLIERRRRDPNVLGWARVSDGAPCGFCMMLVGRGPVYSETSGRFRAHDGCGCSVRLVTRADPSGGWSADARAARELYEKAGGLQGLRALLDDRKRAESLALAA